MKLSVLTKARIRLGMALMGDDFCQAIALYQLITDRARDAVTPTGHVVLARCEPLAEALYKQVPGNWQLTVTYTGAGS